MKWETVPFDSIFHFHNGKSINGLVPGKYPIYGSNGIIGNASIYLYTNAIIIGRVGAYCGSVMHCDNEFWASDNTLVVDVSPNQANLRFCFYLLQTMQLNKYAIGSAQPLLTQTVLKKLSCRIPPLTVQKKIADILSAYDALIENNQKQIKLLEEAAQRLYKEWFIDLRFPGHENTPIHNGVPEGWEKCELQQVAKVNENTIAKNYSYEYIDYVDLSSVTAGKIKEKTRYEKTEAPGRAKRIAKDGDIIWGMVRPNLRSYALVMHPTETEVFSTGFCILSAKLVPFSYLYCVVTQPSFVSYLVNCTNGAAYPAVRPEHFEKAVIEKPHKKVLSLFNCIAEPIFREMELLQIQNKQLAEARDRLLPKLMSGEIEV